MQVDYAISKISDIWRKAGNIKNSLAPISKLPPEVLALIATFFEPERQLVDATAVCQHWRATLLSFPRLWSKIHCSNRVQLEAYLKRSKPVPLEINLRNRHFPLSKYLLPHTSRLAALAVWVEDSPDFDHLTHHLRNPIPTLHKFSVIMPAGLSALKLPLGIGKGPLLHVKELWLEGISSFRAPPFPHVTELTWHVDPRCSDPVRLAGLLSTLEQLPVLERVELVFHTNHYLRPMTNPVITLPHVQRMSLHCSKDEEAGIPRVLEFLKLPNLASLVVDTMSEWPWSFSALPPTCFGEHLPNLAELPEMEVHTHTESSEINFRSPSQAVLGAIARPLGEMPYRHDRKFWGGLHLHSVRRLTVTLHRWTKGVEDVWLVGLLRDLGSLEHLELNGRCGYVLRRLRRMMVGRGILLGVKTLTVRSGAYEIHQALRLKDVVDGLGLGIIVICIQDQTPTEGPRMRMARVRVGIGMRMGVRAMMVCGNMGRMCMPSHLLLPQPFLCATDRGLLGGSACHFSVPILVLCKASLPTAFTIRIALGICSICLEEKKRV